MAKGKTGTVADAIDADAALIQAIPELVPTRAESMTIREFIASLTPFFQTARTLEVAAKATLQRARASATPAHADADALIQVEIRQSSTDKKIVEDHWKITSTLFNFQRRLVTARKRATDALDEAATIWQRQHNTFAEMARRTAQAEQDRLRREAEAQAQQERTAELARLEQQALDAEAASGDLSERERSFVDYYTGPYRDPVRAAQQAGYKDPAMQAPRLLSMPKIQAAIKGKLEANALRDQRAAVKDAPLDVQVPTVAPNIAKVGTDRTTKSAEVYDPEAFMAALLDPRTRTALGIPATCATFDQVELNRQARDLGEFIGRWPGVRLVKKTTTV